jgi:hypothetical protein
MSRFKRLTGLLVLLLLGAVVPQLPAAAQAVPSKVYLPAVFVSYPPTIFGVETSLSGISNSRVATHAQNLRATWLRLNGVLWSAVEPVRGSYNWAALSQLDTALEHAQAVGLRPTVIIRGTPRWAAVTPSGCAAVRDEFIPDYARFMAALAQRYKGRVGYWEIGNEPDVDPTLVPSNYPFGCWGDASDPYYGGERFGRMLRAVVPAMRAADPYAQIVIGGLLLYQPETTEPGAGRPELFLEGILRANAANFFDIVAYHAYSTYYAAPNYDHDLYAGSAWVSLGGRTLGKATFLRNIMARYGVNKPLWLNETGLVFCSDDPTCPAPTADFLEAQNDYVVRAVSRAAAANIQQISWYTLDGPGWRNSGLLDASQNPRPVFTTYQRLIATLGQYTSASSLGAYGPDVEAYRFSQRDGTVVDVLWSRSGNTTAVSVPITAFRTATTRDGMPPGLSRDATNIFVAIGFRAVFIVRTP